jgi:hypothetical protein
MKMNRQEFEEQKQSGEVEEVQQDAAVEEEIESEETEVEEVETEETETEETEESEEDIEIPEEQKTAFAKRLEREQKKIREAAEKEIKEQYDSQYGKHKSIVDLLGGDPDKVEQMIRDNQTRAKVQQSAQTLADQYGWDEEQTNQYVQQQVQQQQKDQELADLKVQVQINELKDNPDYAGISSMKKEIQSMISRSNGSLDVEQAYWALGGKNRAEQLRRETEQREIAKRSKTKRTVQSDSPTATTSEKPLSTEDERMRQKMGLSITEARKLLQDGPNNLEEFRKQKK